MGNYECVEVWMHYSDVIMSAVASKITIHVHALMISTPHTVSTTEDGIWAFIEYSSRAGNDWNRQLLRILSGEVDFITLFYASSLHPETTFFLCRMRPIVSISVMHAEALVFSKHERILS